MKTNISALILVLLSGLSVFGLGGCSSNAGGPDIDIPADWPQSDSGCEFYFRAPAEMKKQVVSGIDSCVGNYLGAGMNLYYDYGFYSDPLVSHGASAEYTEESATIGGFDAKVISLRYEDGREMPYVAAVHFPDVDRGSSKLTMWINCEGPTELDTARKILHSITFPE